MKINKILIYWIVKCMFSLINPFNTYLTLCDSHSLPSTLNAHLLLCPTHISWRPCQRPRSLPLRSSKVRIFLLTLLPSTLQISPISLLRKGGLSPFACLVVLWSSISGDIFFHIKMFSLWTQACLDGIELD